MVVQSRLFIIYIFKIYPCPFESHILNLQDTDRYIALCLFPLYYTNYLFLQFKILVNYVNKK